MRMKTRTLFLSLGIALLTASCGGGSTTSQPANNAAADTTAKTACANFKLGTGVNVSHWLSQSDNRGEERANQITKKDFDSIAAMGFDHVRLPIDEVQMYDENMNRHEEAFALMKNAIDWTLENNMNIIIDLHIIRSFHFNARPGENTLFQKPGEKEKLIAIWKDLQSFLKDYPNDRLAYELLNEAIAPSHEELNELEARLIASIRETEPERTIIVGSNWQQSVETIQYLKVPENDKNLILSFHYYNPILVTHYRAHWTVQKKYDGKIQYPGLAIEDTSFYASLPADTLAYFRRCNQNYDINVMEQEILPAIKKGEEYGLQVYCGEFGVFPEYIDKETRMKWYRDITTIFKKHNINNAHWCYKGDFPVVNTDGSPNDLPAILLEK